MATIPTPFLTFDPLPPLGPDAALDAFADACAEAVDDHLEDLARDLEDGLAWGLDPNTRGISDRERAAGERGDSARVFGYLCGRAKLAQDAGAEGSDWTLDEILGT